MNRITLNQTERRSPFPVLISCFLMSAFLLGTTDQAAACHHDTEAAPAETIATEPEPSLEEQWGVKIVSLRPTAGGRMLDFRYRVLDAGKARPLFDRGSKPYLIDEESGKVLGVANFAKTGPLRNSNIPQEGKIYWMFFGNGGGLIEAGDAVTLEIGDFRAESIIVQDMGMRPRPEPAPTE